MDVITQYDQHTPPSPILRFEKIYEATYSKLYSFVKYYVWGNEAVEDVLQECYIRLWENLDTIKDDDRIMPMLRTYVTRITIDAVRKKSKELERDTTYYAQQPLTCETDERLDMQTLLRRYQEAVAALPPQQRNVFTLVREKGLSYQEISEILNISTHTIKRHMHEALNTLRTKMPSETLVLLYVLMDYQLFAY